MFKKILVANRGEIALRVICACKELGISTVAVYSEADRYALHVRFADEAVCIGPPRSAESYLNVASIISAAEVTDAEAIHPGYGFLSENANFAEVCETSKITFIGPRPEVMRLMGDKDKARKTMAELGLPVLPGSGVIASEADGRKAAEQIGYPVMVKASAGGGGRGIRVVPSAEELPRALETAQTEAKSAFGSSDVYLEKCIASPRHIEFQVLADQHGKVVHLGERECSIQRRHQKLVEEAPSTQIDAETRRRIGHLVVQALEKVGYTNAGTVEFLLDAGGRFYFLEMNTRVQVEHPITEWVTGIDIVAAQLRVAAGAPLGFGQADVRARGHAIEARLYAEDPAAGFFPSAGPILALREPAGPGVRVDSGIAAGGVVPVEYDPLLGKISAWGEGRTSAIARLLAALRDTAVLGPTTNLAFLQDVLAHPAFRRAETHTGFLAEHFATWQPGGDEAVAALAAALALARPATPAGEARGRAAAPTPWETLGAWRLGS